MKYIFGPVNSRRLGLSLGIDLLPEKICSFNCIYCEVGPNAEQTCERREYTPTKAIINELHGVLDGQDAALQTDVFTITASGEPTLHEGLGEIINSIKQKTDKPVVVLTNGSLLHLHEVRKELMAADIVIPSLDAARPESFRKINRPLPGLDLETIIEGVAHFSGTFTGQLWLEVLLAKGINDSDKDINALKRALDRIRPGRIQLNTVARPPLEAFASPLKQEELKRIAEQLDGHVEIIVNFSKQQKNIYRNPAANEILQMLKRRPCTADDIAAALSLDPAVTAEALKDMKQAGQIIMTNHLGDDYYRTTR